LYTRLRTIKGRPKFDLGLYHIFSALGDMPLFTLAGNRAICVLWRRSSIFILDDLLPHYHIMSLIYFILKMWTSMNAEEKIKELPLKIKKKNSQAIDFILLKKQQKILST
jgi:hypothetical protein